MAVNICKYRITCEEVSPDQIHSNMSNRSLVRILKYVLYRDFQNISHQMRHGVALAS